MIGSLLEHFAGSFPLWLSPIHVKIISVGEKHIGFVNKLADEFKSQEIRAEVDTNNETVGNKIRKAKMEKIPYVLVIGDKEMASPELSINAHGEKEIIKISKEEFFKKLREEINNKS